MLFVRRPVGSAASVKGIFGMQLDTRLVALVADHFL